jgi:hypothetical protein
MICKTCGVEFNPLKKRTVMCENCLPLKNNEKRVKRKTTLLNINAKIMKIPHKITYEKIIKKNGKPDFFILFYTNDGLYKFRSKEIDLAHYGPKMENLKKGLGDKRGRNNPSDMHMSVPFEVYKKEVLQTVPLLKSIHSMIDDGFEIDELIYSDSISKEALKVFLPYLRVFFN